MDWFELGRAAGLSSELGWAGPALSRFDAQHSGRFNAYMLYVKTGSAGFFWALQFMVKSLSSPTGVKSLSNALLDSSPSRLIEIGGLQHWEILYYLRFDLQHSGRFQCLYAVRQNGQCVSSLSLAIHCQVIELAQRSRIIE